MTGVGKHPELDNRACLVAAIKSGDEQEVISAIATARTECVQWKGGLSLKHDEMVKHA